MLTKTGMLLVFITNPITRKNNKYLESNITREYTLLNYVTLRLSTAFEL
jgi:hypothetical protein